MAAQKELLDLDNDAILAVFSHLRVQDLAQVARVSRRCKAVAQQDALWAQHLAAITSEYGIDDCGHYAGLIDTPHLGGSTDKWFGSSVEALGGLTEHFFDPRVRDPEAFSSIAPVEARAASFGYTRTRGRTDSSRTATTRSRGWTTPGCTSSRWRAGRR